MMRDIRIAVDNLTIAGQLYLPENIDSPYPAVILCHGIPSGIADPTDGGYPLLAATISGEGFAVLTFSFRGTGISEGNFDIKGWTRDLEAAINYLWNLPEIDDASIALVGFSAGASVSIYVAAHDKRISAVAACACPSDFSVISETDNPKLTLEYFRKIGIIRDPEFPLSPEGWLSDFRRINPLRCAADIAPRPLLLVHAREDKVVPVINAQKLYDKAGDPKQMVIMDGDEHRLRRNDAAMAAVISWLRKHLVEER